MSPPAVRTAAKTARVPVWQKWSTPQTLWARLYLIWALDVLLLLAAIIGAQVHRDAMKGVVKDTAPSIVHAQHIRFDLADMDSNAANELLGQPGTMPEAVATYEKRRVDVATELIEAAKNIGLEKKDQAPIEAIQVGLGTFEGRVQRARDLHERGDPAYLNAYREAVNEMDETLLKEADRLDALNDRKLDDIYKSQSNRSMATVFLLLVMGAALLWALGGVQKFLNERMHRVLNPMLVAATLVTLGFIFYTFNALGSERRHLKIAKEDAFDSIRSLWRARAVAYAANADESRYLLDSTRAPDHESAFSAKAALLARIPDGMTFANVAASAQQGNKVEGFTGYLADELNNITFEGEREVAVTTLANFGEYLRIDKDIRKLQRSGKHAEALELCIGTKKGESNWAFDQFDQALGTTLKINQSAFDAAVEQGFSALSYFELNASIVAVVIALLAFFGLLKRIQEYS